jgi:hypothetical protein
MDSGASRSGSAHAGAQRTLHVTRDAMDIDRSDRNDTPGRPKNNERKIPIREFTERLRDPGADEARGAWRASFHDGSHSVRPYNRGLSALTCVNILIQCIDALSLHRSNLWPVCGEAHIGRDRASRFRRSRACAL